MLFRSAPKTEFLQIRLTRDDRERIALAAAADHLDPSTWVRQAILKVLDSVDTNNKKLQKPAPR